MKICLIYICLLLDIIQLINCVKYLRPSPTDMPYSQRDLINKKEKMKYYLNKLNNFKIVEPETAWNGSNGIVDLFVEDEKIPVPFSCRGLSEVSKINLDRDRLNRYLKILDMEIAKTPRTIELDPARIMQYVRMLNPPYQERKPINFKSKSRIKSINKLTNDRINYYMVPNEPSTQYESFSADEIKREEENAGANKEVEMFPVIDKLIGEGNETFMNMVKNGYPKYSDFNKCLQSRHNYPSEPFFYDQIFHPQFKRQINNDQNSYYENLEANRLLEETGDNSIPVEALEPNEEVTEGIVLALTSVIEQPDAAEENNADYMIEDDNFFRSNDGIVLDEGFLDEKEDHAAKDYEIYPKQDGIEYEMNPEQSAVIEDILSNAFRYTKDVRGKRDDKGYSLQNEATVNQGIILRTIPRNIINTNINGETDLNKILDQFNKGTNREMNNSKVYSKNMTKNLPTEENVKKGAIERDTYENMLNKNIKLELKVSTVSYVNNSKGNSRINSAMISENIRNGENSKNLTNINTYHNMEGTYISDRMRHNNISGAENYTNTMVNSTENSRNLVNMDAGKDEVLHNPINKNIQNLDFSNKNEQGSNKISNAQNAKNLISGTSKISDNAKNKTIIGSGISENLSDKNVGHEINTFDYVKSLKNNNIIYETISNKTWDKKKVDKHPYRNILSEKKLKNLIRRIMNSAKISDKIKKNENIEISNINISENVKCIEKNEDLKNIVNESVTSKINKLDNSKKQMIKTENLNQISENSRNKNFKQETNNTEIKDILYKNVGNDMSNNLINKIIPNESRGNKFSENVKYGNLNPNINSVENVEGQKSSYINSIKNVLNKDVNPQIYINKIRENTAQKNVNRDENTNNQNINHETYAKEILEKMMRNNNDNEFNIEKNSKNLRYKSIVENSKNIKVIRDEDNSMKKIENHEIISADKLNKDVKSLQIVKKFTENIVNKNEGRERNIDKNMENLNTNVITENIKCDIVNSKLNTNEITNNMVNKNLSHEETLSDNLKNLINLNINQNEVSENNFNKNFTSGINFVHNGVNDEVSPERNKNGIPENMVHNTGEEKSVAEISINTHLNRNEVSGNILDSNVNNKINSAKNVMRGEDISPEININEISKNMVYNNLGPQKTMAENTENMYVIPNEISKSLMNKEKNPELNNVENYTYKEVNPEINCKEISKNIMHKNVKLEININEIPKNYFEKNIYHEQNISENLINKGVDHEIKLNQGQIYKNLTNSVDGGIFLRENRPKVISNVISNKNILTSNQRQNNQEGFNFGRNLPKFLLTNTNINDVDKTKSRTQNTAQSQSMNVPIVIPNPFNLMFYNSSLGRHTPLILNPQLSTTKSLNVYNDLLQRNVEPPVRTLGERIPSSKIKLQPNISVTSNSLDGLNMHEPSISYLLSTPSLHKVYPLKPNDEIISVPRIKCFKECFSGEGKDLKENIRYPTKPANMFSDYYIKKLRKLKNYNGEENIRNFFKKPTMIQFGTNENELSKILNVNLEHLHFDKSALYKIIGKALKVDDESSVNLAPPKWLENKYDEMLHASHRGQAFPQESSDRKNDDYSVDSADFLSRYNAEGNENLDIIHNIDEKGILKNPQINYEPGHT